jgi:hypothetical protein
MESIVVSNVGIFIASIYWLTFFIVPRMYEKKASILIWILTFFPFAIVAYFNYTWRSESMPRIYYSFELIAISIFLGTLVYLIKVRRQKRAENSVSVESE